MLRDEVVIVVGSSLMHGGGSVGTSKQTDGELE
jgi:hypothetical protein